MPHDSQGKPLSKGDVATVTFEVTAVHAGEEGCNVSLVSVRPAAYGESYLPMLSCNAKLVTKVDATPRAVNDVLSDDFLTDLEAGDPVTEPPDRSA